MQLVSTTQYSEHLERSAARTLDTLDKLDERMTTQFSGQRGFQRKQFRGHATIVFPDPSNPVFSLKDCNSCKVWARSISAGGMSFIYPKEFKPRKIIVGLELGGAELVWFQAEIVRVKEVPEEDFWAYGVAFRDRLMI